MDRPEGHALQPMPLFGREAELSLARQLLSRDDVRLLTVAGPPGVGKSRLAMALFDQVAPQFAEGAEAIDLADLNRAEDVAGLLLSRLRLEAESTVAAREWQRSDEATRAAIILLDNFEHLLSAASSISFLLSRNARLKLLVTSRVPLRLRWEHVLELGPLPYGLTSKTTDEEGSPEGAAIRLFVARARAADANFEVTPENLRAISDLCARLDGLPLAIDLLAARVAVLPPRAVQSQASVSVPLDLLTSTAADVPPRHRSLRDAIGSSYALLSAPEQRLLRRVALFGGGFNLDAALAVSGEDSAGWTVFTQLGALTHSKLLRRSPSGDAETRFHMLNTIRAYALERLTACGELGDVRQLWLGHLAALVRTASQVLNAPDSLDSAHEALEQEHDNVRAGLSDCLAVGDLATGLQLACGWWRFWLRRGYFAEGRKWLADLLAEPSPGVNPSLRARALNAAACLANHQGDTSAADRLEREALAIWRTLQDAREIATSLDTLAHLAHRRGDVQSAAELFEESLLITRTLDDDWSIADTLQALGDLALTQGNLEHASMRYRESLQRWMSSRDFSRVATVLQQLATVAAARGDAARAVRLLGAAMTQRHIALDQHMSVVTPLAAQRSVEAAARALTPRDAAAHTRQGQSMTLEEAVRYALEKPVESEAEAATPKTARRSATPGSPPVARALDELTAREREVARLLLRGMTNRQIGAELGITERTAETHVCRILAKLNLDSRAQFARFVLDNEETLEADGSSARH